MTAGLRRWKEHNQCLLNFHWIGDMWRSHKYQGQCITSLLKMPQGGRKLHWVIVTIPEMGNCKTWWDMISPCCLICCRIMSTMSTVPVRPMPALQSTNNRHRKHVQVILSASSVKHDTCHIHSGYQILEKKEVFQHDFTTLLYELVMFSFN